MVRIIFLIILLSIAASIKPSQPLRIGIITDIHYLSEQLMDGGSALDKYMQSSGRMIKYTPYVLDSVLYHYKEGCKEDDTNIDILLVCGDITKDGEKQSHLDFVEKLKPLQKKGVHIFVVPGNHDINMPNAVGYKEDKTYKVDNVSPKEFEKIYSNCGYYQAFKRDTASLSYAAVISKSSESETWLLAIDAARYNEYTTHSISRGRILSQTEKWIVNLLAEAKEKNAQVIGMMHWGLVEHFPMQSTLMKEYLIDDWQRLAKLFADNGMIAIFTGHSHANDITRFLSPSGTQIYDIETGALTSYPFSYRVVDLYPSNMNVSTFNIKSLPQNQKLGEESKSLLYNLSKATVKNKLNNLPFELPIENKELFADILAQIFLLHVGGDEVISEKLKEQIKILMNADNFQEDGNFELDFPPEDNNVTITF